MVHQVGVHTAATAIVIAVKINIILVAPEHGHQRTRLEQLAVKPGEGQMVIGVPFHINIFMVCQATVMILASGVYQTAAGIMPQFADMAGRTVHNVDMGCIGNTGGIVLALTFILRQAGIGMFQGGIRSIFPALDAAAVINMAVVAVIGTGDILGIPHRTERSVALGGITLAKIATACQAAFAHRGARHSLVTAHTAQFGAVHVPYSIICHPVIAALLPVNLTVAFFFQAEPGTHMAGSAVVRWRGAHDLIDKGLGQNGIATDVLNVILIIRANCCTVISRFMPVFFRIGVVGGQSRRYGPAGVMLGQTNHVQPRIPAVALKMAEQTVHLLDAGLCPVVVEDLFLIVISINVIGVDEVVKGCVFFRING